MKGFLKIVLLLCAVITTVACSRPNRKHETADPLPVKYENELFSIAMPSGWEVDDSGWLGLDSMQNEVEIYVLQGTGAPLECNITGKYICKRFIKERSFKQFF